MEKEGTTNDISLFLDLINVKDSQILLLLCRCFKTLVVCSNTTLLKLQTVLFLFLFKIGGAAYIPTFTVIFITRLSTCFTRVSLAARMA